MLLSFVRLTTNWHDTIQHNNHLGGRPSIGDPITPSGILIKMMKNEVLLASLPGLSPKPVAVGAALDPGMKDLLTRLGEVQIESLEREEAWRVERENPKLITTQYPLGGQF